MADILLRKNKNQILIHESNKISDNFQNTSFLEVTWCEALFVAVMIGSSIKVIVTSWEIKLQDTIILGLCSIKVSSGEIMKKYLPDGLDIVTAHALDDWQNYSSCTFNIIQQLENKIAIMRKQIGVSE